MNEFPSSPDNPYQSPIVTGHAPPAPRRKLEMSEGSIFVTWIVFYLGSIIATVVIAFPVGMVIGMAMAAQELPMQSIQLLGQLAGGVIGIIMSYVAFRLVVWSLVLSKIKVLE